MVGSRGKISASMWLGQGRLRPRNRLIGARSCCAGTRSDPGERHDRDASTAGCDANNSDRVRWSLRSRCHRDRVEFGAAGRQRHRVNELRTFDGWQMAELAQGCSAAAHLRLNAVWPGSRRPGPSSYVRTAQDAGERLSLKVTAAVVADVAAIEPAIAAMSGDGGLAVFPDGFNITNRKIIIALAAKHRMPAIYTGRYNVVDGGLMSDRVDVKFVFRDGARYVGRILRGAKPRRTAGAVPDQVRSGDQPKDRKGARP